MSNIDNYQQDIIFYKSAGSTNTQILAWLEDHGVSTSERTLERRLQAWGCRRKTNAPTSEIPISRVQHLFQVDLLSDSDITAKIAEEYGLECTENQIREIRVSERLLWRNRSPTDQATSKATTQHLIQEYVLTGSGRAYGCIWASTFLKEKLGFRARRRDVAAAPRTLDPEGTAARTPGLRRARIEYYITDGPNQLWCLDGHDKISQYYIQIYAAVDAYSRKVLWIYCGTANRAKYSILYQYLQTVRLLGRCPRYIRTDKGSETGAVAAAQFRLFIEHAFKEPGWSDTEYEALSLSAAEFFHGGTEVIPDWYEHFLRLVRGHVGAQDLPLLDLAPRPFMVGVDEVV